jgi:putative tricarboxylic transport membrane protein
MGKADRISGIFWLVFAVVVIIESYRLGLGTLHQPGPGFLFFWAAIMLGIMALGILMRAGVNKPSRESQILNLRKLNIGKVILVLASLFLYSLLMEKLGFILTTVMLFIFLLGVVEKKKWLFTIFTSVIVTALTYVVFEIWLKSQLPKGVFGFLRF